MIKKFYGPPGTGKTTTLLNEVDKLLSDGAHPDRICFISFARKSVAEAVDRACLKFGFAEKPEYFKTIHSLCFYQLGLSKREVFGPEDKKALGQILNIPFSIDYSSFYGSEDTLYRSGAQMGDKMVALDNLTRVSLQDPRQIYNEKSDDSFSLYDYEYFLEGYQKYKSVNRKVDFTDMLEKFTRIKPVPEIDYLIVDEVQDLSALQWKVVDIISKCVTDTWLAGDDDQAIFGWAGAEAQIFNDHEGEEIVLDQSYRVPKKVHIYATKLISTIINRKEKNYYPTDMEGDVKYIINMDELPTDKGTWYLLARNNEFLKEFEEFCITQGYLFTIKKNEADKLVRNGAIRAVVLYNKLLNGEALTKQNCIDIYAFMATRSRVEYGYKKILEREEEEGRFTLDLLIKNYGLLVGDVWQWQLNRLTETERNYIHLAEDNEDLTEMPRIHISTIHSVKGGEADNVALLPNMLKLSYDQYERDPDEEARVWYVAATRAKKNLYLLAPSETSTYAYPI